MKRTEWRLVAIANGKDGTTEMAKKLVGCGESNGPISRSARSKASIGKKDAGSWAGQVGMFYLMAVFEHSIDPLGRYENQAIHGAGHSGACALKYGEGTVG